MKHSKFVQLINEVDVAGHVRMSESEVKMWWDDISVEFAKRKQFGDTDFWCEVRTFVSNSEVVDEQNWYYESRSPDEEVKLLLREKEERMLLDPGENEYDNYGSDADPKYHHLLRTYSSLYPVPDYVKEWRALVG